MNPIPSRGTCYVRLLSDYGFDSLGQHTNITPFNDQRRSSRAVGRRTAKFRRKPVGENARFNHARRR